MTIPSENQDGPSEELDGLSEGEGDASVDINASALFAFQGRFFDLLRLDEKGRTFQDSLDEVGETRYLKFTPTQRFWLWQSAQRYISSGVLHKGQRYLLRALYYHPEHLTRFSEYDNFNLSFWENLSFEKFGQACHNYHQFVQSFFYELSRYRAQHYLDDDSITHATDVDGCGSGVQIKDVEYFTSCLVALRWRLSTQSQISDIEIKRLAEICSNHLYVFFKETYLSDKEGQEENPYSAVGRTEFFALLSSSIEARRYSYDKNMLNDQELLGKYEELFEDYFSRFFILILKKCSSRDQVFNHLSDFIRQMLIAAKLIFGKTRDRLSPKDRVTLEASLRYLVRFDELGSFVRSLVRPRLNIVDRSPPVVAQIHIAKAVSARVSHAAGSASATMIPEDEEEGDVSARVSHAAGSASATMIPEDEEEGGVSSGSPHTNARATIALIFANGGFASATLIAPDEDEDGYREDSISNNVHDTSGVPPPPIPLGWFFLDGKPPFVDGDEPEPPAEELFDDPVESALSLQVPPSSPSSTRTIRRFTAGSVLAVVGLGVCLTLFTSDHQAAHVQAASSDNVVEPSPVPVSASNPSSIPADLKSIRPDLIPPINADASKIRAFMTQHTSADALVVVRCTVDGKMNKVMEKLMVFGHHNLRSSVEGKELSVQLDSWTEPRQYSLLGCENFEPYASYLQPLFRG